VPTQLINILEKRRIGSERREILEEQRALEVVIVQNSWWKLFDVAVTVDERRGSLGPEPAIPG